MSKNKKFLDYNTLIRDNLLNVVKHALGKTSDYGLTDGHHFYITFITNFKENVVIHIKNISSEETKCKKNKIGQCFRSNTKSINVTVGRSDQVKFQDSHLILTFLGCSQSFKLKNYINFIEAMPNKKKCFWTGKKHFYLKKYNGLVNITE